MQIAPLEVGGVVIEEIDIRSLSDDDIEAVNTYGNIMRAEANPDDPPTPVELTGARIRNIPDFVAIREFWGRDPDGSIAASVETSFLRTDENRHVMNTYISVRRDRRGRGIARALLGLAAEVASAEERPLLIGWSSERVPAGEAFAQRVGAERGVAVHQNRLVLAEVDRDLVRRWVEEGPKRAPGYSLVVVDGPYPGDLVEAAVDLHDVMNTAPRDDLDVEDQHFTVEQAREIERSLLAAGTERWTLFARHDATGDLVGFTDVHWNQKQPETVGQGDTGVRPEHRGHALGKWLKAAMLQRILDERTQALDIRTGNADSNDAMLGINQQLGFKPFEAGTVWQVQLDKVRDYLGSSR